MRIEEYREFEIFQDDQMFDLYSFRGLTIGQYYGIGGDNKNPYFDSIEKVRIYIDGYWIGRSSQIPVINNWTQKNNVDYCEKILLDK